jgi:mannan endo-1,4-beta-mannosidase
VERVAASPGEHDERVLEALDYVVWQAGRRGLRLILALVNHWDDYGGRRQYAAWSSTAKRADDFYRDAACRRWYRSHARTLVERTNTYTGRVYHDDYPDYDRFGVYRRHESTVDLLRSYTAR